MLQTARCAGAALILAFTATISLAQAVTVSPAQMGRWIIRPTNTAEARFDATRPDPLLGRGGLRLSTGAGDGKDQGGKVWFGTSDFDGLPLSKLTSLSYAVLVESASNPLVAPYINIHIDTNDNGKWDSRFGGDDILVFDPCLQPPPSGNLPMKTGTWNTGLHGAVVHDAGPDTGGWWIVGKENIAGRSGNLKTLREIVAALGDHKIIGNNLENVTGVSFIAGAAGGGTFANFVGYLDKITVGLGGVDTVYDLEWSPPRAATPPAAPEPPAHSTPTSGLTTILEATAIVAALILILLVAVRKARR